MQTRLAGNYAKLALTASSIYLILCLSACRNSAEPPALRTLSPTATPQTPAGAMTLQVPGQKYGTQYLSLTQQYAKQWRG
jgi:hypothetical protein